MKFVFLFILILLVGCVPAAKNIVGSALVDSRTPTISVASSATVLEGAGTTTLSVSMNRVSTGTVSVPFILYGTATPSGTDYSLVAGTTATRGAITINAGQLTGSKVIQVINDALVEGNETIIAIFGTPTNAIGGSNVTQTITIIDDDITGTLPSVTFNATYQISGEASGAGVSLTANLTGGPATFDIYVPFTVNSTSTATNILEYTLSNNVIKVPAGSTNASITVTIIEDTLFEGGLAEYEKIIFNMGTPVNAYTGVITAHTVYVYDNEALPTIGFSSATQALTEANTTLAVTASLSVASSVPVYLSVTQTGGTASGSGIDYNFTPNTKNLMIPANMLTATTNVNIFNDTVYESAVAETVILTLAVSTPSGIAIGIGTQTISITDNDSAPVVNFLTSSLSVSETIGTINVPVTITGTAQDAYTIAYAVSGTAIGINGTPIDHSLNTATGGTLTIPANTTSGIVSFTVVNDNYGETSESVVLNLSAGAGYTVGTTSEFAISLSDDDPTPTISFSQPSTLVTEGDAGSQTINLTISLSNPAGTTVSAIITELGTALGAGVDYTISTTTVQIPPTISSTTVAINVIGETMYETSESLSLTLGTILNAVAGTYPTHSISILNNDSGPTLSFSVSPPALSEASGTSITFTAQASAVSGLNITIPYVITGTATTAVDYSAPASATGSISIPAGTTSASVTVTPINDVIYEGTETVIITTLTPGNASGTTVSSISILDNEPAPTISFLSTNAILLEDPTTNIATINLDFASATTTTVPFTVTTTGTSGVDYILNSGTIIFPAGSTSQTLNTSILEDTLDETTETVTITLNSPIGGTLSPTASAYAISITDDDILVSFTSSSAITSEGAIVTVNLQVADVDNSNLASTSAITGTFNFYGTAVQNTDYTASASTFTIPIGVGTTTLAISITQDTYNENLENVGVGISSVSNAIAGTISAIDITINNSDPVTSMALGTYHTCVLVDEETGTNHIKCWGQNSDYQTGDANAANDIGDAPAEVGATLAAVNLGGANPIAIAAGSKHTCAIITGGTVRCWGDNQYGQLGNGTTTDSQTAVTPAISGAAISITAGIGHTCILNSVGQVQCWGLNSTGQLGINTNVDTLSPGTLAILSTTATYISAGASYSCAVLSTGTVKCWGYNSSGQTGIDVVEYAVGDAAGEMTSWPAVNLTGAGFSAADTVSAGPLQTCAHSIDVPAKVACWGWNVEGQLGQNNTTNYGYGPTMVVATMPAISFYGGAEMSKIVTGGMATCAIDALTKELKCWGKGTSGTLGQESTSHIGNGVGLMMSSASFNSIALPVTKDVSNIFMGGGGHACAIINYGRIKCWGNNTKGQLGRGDTSTIGDGAGEMGASLLELNF